MEDNELQHFGVPGMRWGHRKARAEAGLGPRGMVTRSRQNVRDQRVLNGQKNADLNSRIRTAHKARRIRNGQELIDIEKRVLEIEDQKVSALNKQKINFVSKMIKKNSIYNKSMQDEAVLLGMAIDRQSADKKKRKAAQVDAERQLAEKFSKLDKASFDKRTKGKGLAGKIVEVLKGDPELEMKYIQALGELEIKYS
jgi:hypothetical protein